MKFLTLLYCWQSLLLLLLLLSGPTVVIVQPPIRPAIVNQNKFLRFFPNFEKIPRDFETIPILSGLRIRFKGKLRALHPSRPNVGDWEPSVGLLLFTRPTVGQRCCMLARPTVVLLLLLTIRTVFSFQRLEALFLTHVTTSPREYFSASGLWPSP
jgi:hypothetical protein